MSSGSDKKPLLQHVLPQITLSDAGNPQMVFHSREQEMEANWGCYSCLHWLRPAVLTDMGDTVIKAFQHTRRETYKALVQSALKQKSKNPMAAARVETDKRFLPMWQNLTQGAIGLCTNRRRPDIAPIHWVNATDTCTYFQGRAAPDGGALTVLPAEVMEKRGLS